MSCPENCAPSPDYDYPRSPSHAYAERSPTSIVQGSVLDCPGPPDTSQTSAALGDCRQAEWQIQELCFVKLRRARRNSVALEPSSFGSFPSTPSTPMLGTLMSDTSGWSGTFLHGTEKGSELVECEELLLTWIPVNAPRLVLFMAAYSSTRTIHQSLMRLVCGVGFSRATVATFNASV